METDENGVVTETVLKQYCIVYKDADEGMHLERKIRKCTNADLLLMYHSLKIAVQYLEKNAPELIVMHKFFEGGNAFSKVKINEKDRGGSIFEE